MDVTAIKKYLEERSLTLRKERQALLAQYEKNRLEITQIRKKIDGLTAEVDENLGLFSPVAAERNNLNRQEAEQWHVKMLLLTEERDRLTGEIGVKEQESGTVQQLLEQLDAPDIARGLPDGNVRQEERPPLQEDGEKTDANARTEGEKITGANGYQKGGLENTGTDDAGVSDGGVFDVGASRAVVGVSDDGVAQAAAGVSDSGASQAAAGMSDGGASQAAADKASAVPEQTYSVSPGKKEKELLECAKFCLKIIDADPRRVKTELLNAIERYNRSNVSHETLNQTIADEKGRQPDTEGVAQKEAPRQSIKACGERVKAKRTEKIEGQSANAEDKTQSEETITGRQSAVGKTECKK